MRIAYLCPDVDNPPDGPLSARVRVGGLTHALLHMGHDVRVFTPAGGADAVGRDVPVVELRVQPFVQRTADLLESDPMLGPAAASEARSLYASVLRRRADAPIKEFAPELVIERSSLFGGAGLTIARKAGIPIIVDVIAPVVDPGATGRTRLRPAWIRNADHLIAATPQLGTWLGGVARDADRVQVLSGGVEVDLYDAAQTARDRIRAELELDGREIVGYVGELDAQQNLEPLVLALGLLDRDGIDPQLVVVGEGPQREPLDKLVRAVGLTDLVTFTGAPPHADIPAYIAAFDVAVRSAADESLELLGCLAAARPVAAPDVEDHHCLQSGKTAWFYPEADPGSLAVTIGMVLRNPRWGEELARAGREHVREHHSWERTAERIVALEGAQAAAAGAAG
jgi:glycosyltransferase involved in cell wall biosynthesis